MWDWRAASGAHTAAQAGLPQVRTPQALHGLSGVSASQGQASYYACVFVN